MKNSSQNDSTLPMWVQKKQEEYSPLRNFRENNKLLFNNVPYNHQFHSGDYNNFKKHAFGANLLQKQLLDIYSHHLNNPESQFKGININTGDTQGDEGEGGRYSPERKITDINLNKILTHGSNPVNVINHELTHANTDLDPKAKSYYQDFKKQLTNNLQNILYNQTLANKEKDEQYAKYIEDLQETIDPTGVFSEEYPPKDMIKKWIPDEYNAFAIEKLNEKIAPSTNPEHNKILKTLYNNQRQLFRNYVDEIKKDKPYQFPQVDLSFQERLEDLSQEPTQKIKGSLPSPLPQLSVPHQTRYSDKDSPHYSEDSFETESIKPFKLNDVSRQILLNNLRANNNNQSNFNFSNPLNAQQQNSLGQHFQPTTQFKQQAARQQNQHQHQRQNRFERAQSRNRSNRRQEETKQEEDQYGNPLATGGSVSSGLGSLYDYIHHRYAGGGGVGLGSMGRFFGIYPSDY
jgi:hypothetical protein